MANSSPTIINPLTVTTALIFHKKCVVFFCRVTLHDQNGKKNTNISKEDQAYGI